MAVISILFVILMLQDRIALIIMDDGCELALYFCQVRYMLIIILPQMVLNDG
jgi:hypothetical protein